MPMRRGDFLGGLFLFLALLSGCAAESPAPAPVAPPTATVAAPDASWPRYPLRAEQSWQLDAPDGERFDASGLLRLPNGDLLTVNDRSAGLYRIQFGPATNVAALVQLTNCFTPAQLAPFKRQKRGRYDCEGIARDEQGRLYLCEESNRWILRWDPATQKVERLAIDWSPVQKYFSPTDDNASFEGIAIGRGRLYVANERSLGRLIVVDLATLKIVDDFVVRRAGVTTGDVHYSDLCWFEDSL